ncbi:tnpA4 domain protein [Candidatus Erwinia dacicola]|uniref:TnpA4 domain protein n=1 Tax=Candidatus Erwinia dacicola TaxID=252393 RepID=A0A328TJ91_9GAMM|nr:tnpA4 domain protein [Candidatus Erwinia dacicola]
MPMKITRQLKFIRFAGESAITLSLLSGQKIDGHTGIPT